MEALAVLSYRLVTTRCCWQDGGEKQLSLQGVDRDLLIRGHVQYNKENAVNDTIYLCEK